jgi:hypothetical protein
MTGHRIQVTAVFALLSSLGRQQEVPVLHRGRLCPPGVLLGTTLPEFFADALPAIRGRIDCVFIDETWAKTNMVRTHRSKPCSEVPPSELSTWQRIGALLNSFTSQDCANYIRNAEYAAT